VIVAGLTGGIASGKSTVSRILADAGARVIDADRIAREVVIRGSPAYADIVAFFGREVLRKDGEIDRSRLGDIIFNDPEKQARLNAIVHPRVFDRSERMIADIAARTPGAVVILDVPLLLEAGMDRDLAELIVVYVPESLQLERLMRRDDIDAAAAMARIRSQMPIEEKRRRATIVIDNSGGPDACRRQALAVYRRLKSRAGQPGH
ncbi:MAG TPA: dephospho-CoA kinase, partial [Desulfosarcina sp.]|nr:dephospho-CoA kinase [Desulfosarcina sp.]